MNTNAELERALLFSFMETAGEPDLMSSTVDLRDWLVTNGLLPADAPVSDEDLRLARRARASLFAMLVAKSTGQLDSRVPSSLAAISGAAPLVFESSDEGELRIVPSGTGVPRAMSELLAIVYRATISGEFSRWKACRKCAWPFFDSSKNRSRVWCDMQLCGSQEKAKHYRQRRAHAPG